MRYLIFFILLTSIFSCEKNSEIKKSTNSMEITISMIENEKDPICNMSTREHLSDTALINGEIWGFCSSVCKEKYLHLK